MNESPLPMRFAPPHIAHTELAKKIVLGCVILPLRQQAESHNLRQSFLANSVYFPIQSSLTVSSRFLAALQRDRERVPHSGGAAVRRQPRRPRDLLDALRDQLRDALQDLRDRAGRARLHHGAHEEVQQHHT